MQRGNRGTLKDLATVLLPPLTAYGALQDALPRWGVMWSMAVAMFAGCKVVAWRGRTVNVASVAQRCAFFLAWPGMNADRFLDHRAASEFQTGRANIIPAMACLACGALLFWGIARSVPADLHALRAWCGMIGAVLMLHFGALQLLGAAWRARGVDARPLMEAPVLSASVAEFWGRRWNTAFRDLSAQFLFRPFARRFGAGAATWLTFLFSGIVHDVVISLPAGGGFGLPTSYFLLQAAAMQIERGTVAKYLHGRLLGRAFAWLVVVGPAGLLFHAPFRYEIILPWMKAWGAL
jgi:hypothetical protein